jgi:hypothetical protein
MAQTGLRERVRRESRRRRPLVLYLLTYPAVFSSLPPSELPQPVTTRLRIGEGPGAVLEFHKPFLLRHRQCGGRGRAGAVQYMQLQTPLHCRAKRSCFRSRDLLSVRVVAAAAAAEPPNISRRPSARASIRRTQKPPATRQNLVTRSHHLISHSSWAACLLHAATSESRYIICCKVEVPC